jgi:putative ATP-dependent endonuclease of OLD family
MTIQSYMGMKISKITVRNFRSVKYAEIDVDNFNIFVGQNNHGKTNFFEAIDWFYSAKGDTDRIRFGREGTAEISVEIEFTDIQDGISKMKNEKNKTTIKKLLGDITTVKVKRSSLELKTRKFFDEATQEWKKPAQDLTPHSMIFFLVLNMCILK